MLAAGLPYLLAAREALGEFFIAGKRSLVVAGTHGKTTSTAMLGVGAGAAPAATRA